MASPSQLILNVDDYAPGRYARTKLLTRAGFDVQEAGTGADALRIAAQIKPQLILLDVNLPDVSGLDVCHQLKESQATSDIPVLHVSASSLSPADVVRGLDRGADGYLTEPVPPELLIATIRALLRARQAQDKLQSSDQELLQFSLLSAQEEERRRIARELHDGLAQHLALLAMEMETVRKSPVADWQGFVTRMDSLVKQVDALSEDVRRISHDLHPSSLEDLGLEGALRQLVREYKRVYGMQVDFVAHPLANPLPLGAAAALYRIAQEALRNAVKHAPGALVRLELRSTKRELCLRITDDGPGFDPNSVQKGLGIVSMRERARLAGGRLLLDSGPGTGTDISVILPWVEAVSLE